MVAQPKLAPPSSSLASSAAKSQASAPSQFGSASSPSASSSPSSPPNPILVAQQQLQSLGFPDGGLDGRDGPRTRQGLCAFREALGLPGGRAPLTGGDQAALAARSGLPAANHLPDGTAAWAQGVAVDQTCQVAYLVQQGRIAKVMEVSTGRPSHSTANGSFTVGFPVYTAGPKAGQRLYAGWTDSTLYPQNGWMLDFMPFNGPEGLHGVYPGELPPNPQSHGCVRMSEANATKLWSTLQPGNPVVVFGRY